MTDPGVPAPTLVISPAVVRALLEGEQIIDLRLDGPPIATRFWLAPTAPDIDLKPAYRMARDLSVAEEAPPGGDVRIEGWAEVVATAEATLDAERIAALDSKTVAALDAMEGTEVSVVVLRVHRLAEPLTTPADFRGLPAEPWRAPSEPALSDTAFEARLQGVGNALPGGLTPAGDTA